MSEARYAIGIDLGTTHCALSYIQLADSQAENLVQGVLDIPQLAAPGSIEEKPLLASFLYIPHGDEFAPGALALPWDAQGHFVVGELARQTGARTPMRLVASAKSWLCHPGVDRRAPILPLDAAPEISRLSPLQVSIEYLTHLRQAWDHRFPDAPLAMQQVVLTVPASFDPAARELTAEAAEAAELGQFLLLEEPTAAFYNWIGASQGSWRQHVKAGDVVLVVDVGGGTTDLSLIAVTEKDGNLELHRIAVGDHILLGGDNMDLALAHVARGKLQSQGVSLDAWQMQALTHSCRAAKETLLNNSSAEAMTVVAPSRGSRLIANTVRTELTRDDVTRTLVDGFFPIVESSARPLSRPRSALTTLGLPYASDAAVTRHLAGFLSRQTGAAEAVVGEQTGGSFLYPTAILFNGGVFKAQVLAQRVLDVLNTWLDQESAPQARLLDGVDLDLAVARGAAYYNFARSGRGVRIRGGTARAYYIGVESAVPAVPGIEPPIQALCVAPFGMEEGSEAQSLPQELGLVVGERVQFRFFGSSTRRQDVMGNVVSDWTAGELEELQAIHITLSADERTPGDIVPVKLRASISELGTLQLEAIPRSGAEHWKVEFDARTVTN